ncbi:rhomboid-like protein [Streptomyces sp. WZ-12]|uniref:rhomboid-like protein n=1 Tax=Streptomyces sp. WZ-12 TaxID=3030210 RepID=UPI00238176AB|nr:rhomboid-like protein [Streptomyces sp. WZ-12]
MTPLYVGALQLGVYATARLPASRRTALLRAHSTNVANLRAGRWGTLATSAAFAERPISPAYGVALLAALGTAEARWGAGCTAAVFAAGHVGASLLIYAGLRGRPGARPEAVAPPIPGAPGDAGAAGGATAHAVDVGASYGFYATLGALAASLPHRGARVAASGGLLALGAVPVVRRGRTFTDAGHLTALALGVAVGAVRTAARGRFPATGRASAEAAASTTPVREAAVSAGPPSARGGARPAGDGIASQRGWCERQIKGRLVQ